MPEGHVDVLRKLERMIRVQAGKGGFLKPWSIEDLSSLEKVSVASKCTAGLFWLGIRLEAQETGQGLFVSQS